MSMNGQWVLLDSDTWPGSKHKKEVCKVTAVAGDVATLTSQYGYTLCRSKAYVEHVFHSQPSIKLIVFDSSFVNKAPQDFLSAIGTTVAVGIRGLEGFVTESFCRSNRVLFTLPRNIDLTRLWSDPSSFGTWDPRTTVRVTDAPPPYPTSEERNTISADPTAVREKLVLFLAREVAPAEDVREVLTKWICPKSIESSRNYVIVYGPYMYSHARSMAGIEVAPGDVQVVKVSGYSRAWGKRGSMLTNIGIQAGDESSHFHGIAFPVQSFAEFDIREGGFKRIQIENQRVSPNIAEAKYYLYVPDKVQTPGFEAPIFLSYVDVLVAGALENDKSIAEELFNNTSGWGYVYDDRSKPKYRHSLVVKDSDKAFTNEHMQKDWIVVSGGAADEDDFTDSAVGHRLGEWDQFEANKGLAGETTYNDAFYTTAIPTLTSEEARKVEEKVRAIENSKAMNFQHAVDRGEEVDVDEETLHSAVVRKDEN